MKKIIALSLLPAFLSADFVGSFVDGLGSQLGSNLGNSRWVHYCIELFVPLGGMSRLKSSDCKKISSDKNKSTDDINARNGKDYFENKVNAESDKSYYILNGHPLLKIGAGLRFYIGLGTKNFQIGYDAGVAYLFNGSLSSDMGLNLYYRYSNFFARLSGGLQANGFACETKTSNKFFSVGWYGRFQVGYYFYESFYVSLGGAYSKFANKANRGLFKDVCDIDTNNEMAGKSVSVFLSVGISINGYEDNLKAAEETETSKELAKLRARDKYKEEKEKKELEMKKAEEDAKQFEAFQAYKQMKSLEESKKKSLKKSL